MTTDHTAVLAKFNGLCAEQGLLDRRHGMKDTDRTDGITGDTTLLRFLQANQMDLATTFRQFQEATKFHRTKNIARLYDIIIFEIENTRKLYPHWTGRRDSRGLPILMIDVDDLDQAAMVYWRETINIPSKDACADGGKIIPRYGAMTFRAS